MPSGPTWTSVPRPTPLSRKTQTAKRPHGRGTVWAFRIRIAPNKARPSFHPGLEDDCRFHRGKKLSALAIRFGGQSLRKALFQCRRCGSGIHCGICRGLRHDISHTVEPGHHFIRTSPPDQQGSLRANGGGDGPLFLRYSRSLSSDDRYRFLLNEILERSRFEELTFE